MAAKAKNLIKDLVVLLGADNVEQDQQSRDLLSQDLYETGQIADVVVMPETLTHVTDIVKLARLYGRSIFCLLYTSPSPRDQRGSRMPSSA